MCFIDANIECLIQYAGFCLGNPVSSNSLSNCCFPFISQTYLHVGWQTFAYNRNYMYCNIFLFYFDELFLIHLLPILAYQFIKYQRGCDTWQVATNIAQVCIFFTKSHECTVNCAISSRNCSNHYIMGDNEWGWRRCHRQETSFDQHGNVFLRPDSNFC